MSFSEQIKEELIYNEVDSQSNYKIIISCFLRNMGILIIDEKYNIKITFNNFIIAKFFAYIISEEYNIQLRATIRSSSFRGTKAYMFLLDSDVEMMLIDLELMNSKKELTLVPNASSTFKFASAYLRGCFLSCGSIVDPKKGYHLEFIFINSDIANFLQKALLKYNIVSKIIIRKMRYVVYVKRSESISDFLRVIEADKALSIFENIRIEKDYANSENRTLNCYIANEVKHQKALQKQMKILDYIFNNNLLKDFKDREAKILKMRFENQEFSLSQIAEKYNSENNEKINKSTISNLLKKISEKYNF
jgi:DNA-binding protein WhiA